MKKLLIATAIAAATASSMASAITVQDGNSKLNIYGYIKGDARYSFKNNIYDGGDPAADIGKVIAGGKAVDGSTPTGADQTNGHLNFTAQQTRLGFDFNQATSEGDVHAVLEGDFASGGHAYAYRIRQAYVEWQGILAGYTWTNFNSWNSWPNTLDWDGTVGHAGGFRWNQVRYTATVGDSGTASIALEEPADQVGHLTYNTAAGNPAKPTLTDKNSAGNYKYTTLQAYQQQLDTWKKTAVDVSGGVKTQLPDITAKFAGKAGMISYAVGLMGRQFKIDNGSVNDTAAGWGVMASLGMDLSSGTTLGLGAVHGKGLGQHYLFTGEYAALDGAYWDGNSIQTLSQTGATAYIQQNVTSNSFVSLSYGYAKTGYEAGYYASSAPDTLQNAFLTYQITPVKHVTYGVEYGYYRAKNLAGDTGNASQLEFSAKYSF